MNLYPSLCIRLRALRPLTDRFLHHRHFTLISLRLETFRCRNLCIGKFCENFKIYWTTKICEEIPMFKPGWVIRPSLILQEEEKSRFEGRRRTKLTLKTMEKKEYKNTENVTNQKKINEMRLWRKENKSDVLSKTNILQKKWKLDFVETWNLVSWFENERDRDEQFGENISSFSPYMRRATKVSSKLPRAATNFQASINSNIQFFQEFFHFFQ